MRAEECGKIETTLYENKARITATVGRSNDDFDPFIIGYINTFGGAYSILNRMRDQWCQWQMQFGLCES